MNPVKDPQHRDRCDESGIHLEMPRLSPNLKRPKVGAGRQNIGNRRKKAIF